MKPGLAPCAWGEWRGRPPAWEGGPARKHNHGTAPASGACVAVVCGGLVVLGFLIAVPCCPAASPFTTRERLHQPLGPLAEKALAALAEEAEPLERALLVRHMEAVVNEIASIVSLSAHEREALTLDAASMVNAAVKTWKECVAADLRPLLPKYGNDASQAKRVEVWTPGQLVPYYAVRHWTRPDYLPAWAKAVEKRVGAERAGVWQKERAERRASTLAQIERFTDRWADIGRRPMDTSVAEFLRQLQEAAQLQQEQLEKIVAQARALIDEHAMAETEVAKDMLGSMPDETLLAFTKGTKTLNSRFMRPAPTELAAAWRKLAAGVAGEAAMKDWDKKAVQKDEKQKEQILAVLKQSEARERIEVETLMQDEVENLVVMLDLDDTARQKLDALAKRTVDDSLAAAREQWTDILEAWPSADLEKSRLSFLSLKPEERGPNRAMWKEGLKQMFSAADLERAAKSGEERQQRMHKALAQVALADADSVLGLSAAQRAELEPVLVPQMAGFIRAGRPTYWSVAGNSLQLAVRQTPKARVEGFLDAAQRLHWSQLDKILPDKRMVTRLAALGPAPGPNTPPVANVEAEIAQYLHNRALRQREEALRMMQARVEDAQRVLHLTPDKVEHLTTAAKGAVEAEMTPWREQMEGLAVERLEGVTPQNVKVVLAGLDGVRISLGTEGGAAQQVWRQAVAQTLSEPERAAWDKVLAERRAYRVAALAALTTAELDRRHLLSPSQCGKIQRILVGVVGQNLHALENSGLPGLPWAWYLNSSSVLMPLGGVPRADLRGVLTTRQWKNFQDRDLRGAESHWQNMRQRADAAPALNQPFIFFR